MLENNEKEKIINFLQRRFSDDVTFYDCYVWHDEYDYEDSSHYEDVAYEKFGADSFAYGCSKLVLFYEELPRWVVKIPFLGEYYSSEDSYNNYQNANSSDYPIDVYNDYCAIEAFLAKESYGYHVEDMLAKTYYLMTVNDVDIYVSEKVENSYYDRSKTYRHADSPRQANLLRESYATTKEQYCLSLDDLAFFIDSYGVYKTEMLISFIMDYQIEDLHHGNIGFDAYNNIKIIDYSGFHN